MNITDQHRETLIHALEYYRAWMDALARTANTTEGTAECAVEKYRAELALAEIQKENNQ